LLSFSHLFHLISFSLARLASFHFPLFSAAAVLLGLGWETMAAAKLGAARNDADLNWRAARQIWMVAAAAPWQHGAGAGVGGDWVRCCSGDEV
jgi:hypothetical protein